MRGTWDGLRKKGVAFSNHLDDADGALGVNAEAGGGCSALLAVVGGPHAHGHLEVAPCWPHRSERECVCACVCV